MVQISTRLDDFIVAQSASRSAASPAQVKASLPEVYGLCPPASHGLACRALAMSPRAALRRISPARAEEAEVESNTLVIPDDPRYR